MDFKELIAKRHSVHSFEKREVERELLDGIIDAAMTAPSSKNSRSTGFMIVTDPSTLEALSQMRESGSAPLKDAPAAIIVLGDKDKSDMWLINSSISASYIYLAATDAGLGSCWIQIQGRLRCKAENQGETAEDYVRNLLGIKENMGILCAFAIGYPSCAIESTP